MGFAFGYLVLLLALLNICLGLLCDNNCNGHGWCKTYEKVVQCQCFPGWNGSADCSRRTCPYDVAWADKASDYDTAHASAECSRNGMCNRATGICSCFAGFEGQACQRSTCPFDCSGHGKCLTIQKMYDYYTLSKTTGENFTFWEANHTTGCACDIGYSGGNCEIKLCPRGVDPLLNYDYSYPQLHLYTYGINVNSGYVNGSFRISAFGKSFLIPSNETLTAAECKRKFESLPSIGTVNCSVADSSEYGGTDYNVTFFSFPTTVQESNIYVNNGSTIVKQFACDTVAMQHYTSTDCFIIDETDYSKTLPAYETCSDRGVCDLSQGQCSCFQGFTGANCDMYIPPTAQPTAPSDILDLIVDYSGFTGNVMTLTVTNTSDDVDLNFITIQNTYLGSNQTIFNMDAPGNIVSNYGSFKIRALDSKGGLTIGASGLMLTGGVTIQSSGLKVTGGATVFGRMNLKQGGLLLGSESTISTGGLSVTGGITIYNLGLQVTNGLTVFSGGATFTAGGLTITNGVSINSGGFTSGKYGTIQDMGLAVSGGLSFNAISSGSGYGINVLSASINSGGLRVSGGLSVRSSGLIVSGGASINTIGMYVSGGVSISSSGLAVTGGATFYSSGSIISTGGMTVISDGINVKFDGLIATGGFSIQSGGLAVSAGTSVLSGGLVVVSGGATVNSGGIVVVSNGATINTGGLQVTGGVFIGSAMKVGIGTLYVQDNTVIKAGGMTISGGGLRVTGGTTIYNGLKVTGGVTLYDTTNRLMVSGGVSVAIGGLFSSSSVCMTGLGVVVTGGASIKQGGLFVTGGCSVKSVGLSVSGGISVLTQGMRVTGGATVYSTGITVNTGILTGTGMTVVAGSVSVDPGVVVTGGTTIRSGGMQVSGGISILAGGMSVTGGATVSSALYVNAGGMSAYGGMRATGGAALDTLTIVAGGMSVQDTGLFVVGGLTSAGPTGVIEWYGGVTVGDTGLHVDDTGLKVKSRGITATGASSVVSGIIAVTGEVTVGTAGMYVVNTGQTVAGGGLNAYSATFNDIGVSLTGGLSSAGTGMYVTSGVTLLNSGLRVTGGMTDGSGLTVVGGVTVTSTTGANLDSVGYISSSGLTATGGLTVGNLGIKSLNGVTIGSSGLNAYSYAGSDGMYVSGGATINSGGLTATGGLTIVAAYNTGLTTKGGFSINDIGMTVQKYGITLYDTGVVVTGGLTVFGVSASSTFTFLEYAENVFSDRRLKENIVVVDNPLGKMKKLRSVYFNWANEYTAESAHAPRDHERHLGLLAQDVLAAIPEAVQTLENGDYLGVNYKEIVPVIVEAIRELDWQTNELSNRNELIHLELDNYTIDNKVAPSENRTQLLQLIDRLRDRVDNAEKLNIHLRKLLNMG